MFSTLWQRLGRAARDPSKEAFGIYLVEPSYTDHHRLQAEQRAASRAEKAQQKRHLGANTVNSQVETLERVARKKSRRQRDHASVPQWTVGTFIVQEPCHEDYEEAAMDAYINACSQGFCCRALSNEFFDNKPGVYVYVIWNPV